MHKPDKSILTVHILNILIILGLCASILPYIYGFTFFPDEFGYWATAAKLIGFDWSKVASLGSYYSFGYGVILTPILKFITDPVMAYRTAIIVNAAGQIGGYLILCDIAGSLMPDSDKRIRAILCGAGALYPAWTFYNQMTMAEGVMFFLYTLSIWLMAKYIENPGVIRGIPLAATVCYMCCIHIRALGALIACIIIVILCGFRKRKDERTITGAILFIALIAIGAGLWLSIRNSHVSQVYGYADAGRLAINSFSGAFQKVEWIFSLKGIIGLLLSLTGKLLYLGCASFVLAYIGLAGLVKKALSRNNRDLLSGYIALATLGQIAITTIYLVWDAGLDSKRLDLFLHGRYDDYIIPVLMVYGLYVLITDTETGTRKLISSMAVMAGLAIISTAIIAANHNGMCEPHGALMVGMSYLEHDGGPQPLWFTAAECGLSMLIGMSIYVAALIYRRSGIRMWLIAITVIQAVLAYYSMDTMIRRGQGYIFGDVELVRHLEELETDGFSGRRVVNLYENDKEYGDIIQFGLREREVIPVTVTDSILDPAQITSDDLILVDWQSDLREDLDQMYSYGYEMGHFALYYNP